MSVKLNYYLILNVSQTSKEKEIRGAYLRLARKYHPDKNKGNKLAEKKFKQINLAYQVLQDPDKRRAFDEEWRQFQERIIEQKKKEVKSPVKKPRQRAGFLEKFFPEKRQEQAIDIEIPLPASLEDFCQAALKKVSYSIPYNGKIKKKSMKVQIPIGSRPGIRLQFKNKGGANGKKIFGDLFLKLDLNSSSFIKVKGDDIHLDFPIKFTEAFKGIKKEILSPYGTILVAIPPETKHLHIFRFKNLGLPTSHGTKGNMFVKIFIDYPQEKRIKIQNEMKNLSEKNKKSYIEQYETKKELYEKVLNFEKSLKSVRKN